MKIAGIISEYNPFHNGHKYHIEKTKSDFGATHIVAVMSGNYTQRGDVAITEKYKRAKTALENGVDLVVELPVQYSLASAEIFAKGAINILDNFNCIDILSFGSECGDIDLLKETAGAVEYALQSDEFHYEIRQGKSFPRALSDSIRLFYHDIIVDTLNSPNNTLAIEYIKALDDVGSQIKPVTIKRFHANHDEMKAEKDKDTGILSASQIRKMVITGEEFESFLPKSDFSNIADIKKLEIAVLSKLRTIDKKSFSKYANVIGGMADKLYKSVRIASSINELYALVKSKRYTMASIRRAVLSCFLEIKADMINFPPAYIHILGMNSKGREILSKANSSIPINTSLKMLSISSRQAIHESRLAEKCTDLYSLSMQKPMPCGSDFTQKPILINK